MPEFAWRPHPGPQMVFCARGEFEVFFGGTKGPGKTDCLLMEATRGVEDPRYKGLILRRTFPRLEEVIDRCHLWYPLLGGDYKASEHRWYFPSGSKIKLGHVQHEDNKRDYHGKEYHYIGFDELTEFTETQYLFILANIRKTNMDLGLRIRSTSNPGGIGHAWVKSRFVDTCEPKDQMDYIDAKGQTQQMSKPVTYICPKSRVSRCFVPSSVYHNPSIKDNDPGYVDRLEMLPLVERKRLLYGDWTVFEGQVFTELTERTHGCDPFEIPPDWNRYMVFDWGYARPWCALYFAVDFDDNIYLYREHYGFGLDEDGKTHPNRGSKQTNAQICEKIHSLEKEKIYQRIADPACWGPTKIYGSNKMLGPAFSEDAAKQGLYFIKADNDRIRGKQQVHERFQLLEEKNSETGEEIQVPRFYAFKNCHRWWAEFSALLYDQKNVEDVDTDQPDEGYDCTRYMCMARPVKPVKYEKEPSGTFQSERKKLIRAKNYAKRHGTSMSNAYNRIR